VFRYGRFSNIFIAKEYQELNYVEKVFEEQQSK
jgi:hypothetical protein